MRFSQIFRRLRTLRGWPRELLLSVLALAVGFALMPVLYGGLQAGSAASWIVLLGPYGLYLLFRALGLWWRASARLA